MAFTEEQEKAILDFVTKGGAAQSAADKATQEAADKAKAGSDDAAAKSIAQQAKEAVEAAKAKSIVEQAKDAVEAEKVAADSLGKIQESIKFNISVKDFVEKNKNLLPVEAEKILATIATKTFKDDNEKANAARKNLLDSFLSQKENLSVMTVSMQTRAEFYKGLAESDKEKRSSEFWDLAEVGIALKQGARKAEALNKINGGSAGESSGNVLEDKFLAAAKNKFNNKKT